MNRRRFFAALAALPFAGTGTSAAVDGISWPWPITFKAHVGQYHKIGRPAYLDNALKAAADTGPYGLAGAPLWGSKDGRRWVQRCAVTGEQLYVSKADDGTISTQRVYLIDGEFSLRQYWYQSGE